MPDGHHQCARRHWHAGQVQTMLHEHHHHVHAGTGTQAKFKRCSMSIIILLHADNGPAGQVRAMIMDIMKHARRQGTQADPNDTWSSPNVHEVCHILWIPTLRVVLAGEASSSLTSNTGRRDKLTDDIGKAIDGSTPDCKGMRSFHCRGDPTNSCIA